MQAVLDARAAARGGLLPAASCMKPSAGSPSASFTLWRSITHSQHMEHERQLYRSLVPTMGQLGWQLHDDDVSCIGLSWSRPPVVGAG